MSKGRLLLPAFECSITHNTPTETNSWRVEAETLTELRPLVMAVLDEVLHKVLHLSSGKQGTEGDLGGRPNLQNHSEDSNLFAFSAES